MPDKTLQALVDLVSTKKNADELLLAVKKVVLYALETRNLTAKEVEALTLAIDTLKRDIKGANDQAIKDIKVSVESRLNTVLKDTSSKIDVLLIEQNQGMNYLRDKVSSLQDGLDGKTPVKGIDYVDGVDGSPDLPEQIRDKLETLSGEERLDASAIKNLPKAIAETRIVEGRGPLWALSDVDVAGILTGQSIKWDGVRWIPYTPSGANTSVFGEAPADSGDQTNFTLAHTPASGTLRVYRGGAYQQSGVGNDYTLSGSTITLSNVLQTNEKLLVDYEY